MLQTCTRLTAICPGLPGWAGTRKVKPIWILLKQEWQWHQLGRMQVCTSFQADNHASTPPVSFSQAGCPSCRPTNSVKALKGQMNLAIHNYYNHEYTISHCTKYFTRQHLRYGWIFNRNCYKLIAKSHTWRNFEFWQLIITVNLQAWWVYLTVLTLFVWQQKNEKRHQTCKKISVLIGSLENKQRKEPGA